MRVDTPAAAVAVTAAATANEEHPLAFLDLLLPILPLLLIAIE